MILSYGIIIKHGKYKWYIHPFGCAFICIMSQRFGVTAESRSLGASICIQAQQESIQRNTAIYKPKLSRRKTSTVYIALMHNESTIILLISLRQEYTWNVITYNRYYLYNACITKHSIYMIILQVIVGKMFVGKLT